MTPYLRTNKPARPQFRSPRRATPTGLIVVHTAEGVLDTVGPDTGAENVAEFIRRRSDPGSYHDLVDSDSNIQLVEYGDEAYQDGTGSNPFALSISFALRAADWTRLTAERRDAFLRQGAVAFARQQQWLRANDYPMTLLRRISKADSDRGQPGFIGHGERDPGRRTDPGAHFPWDRFFELCAATSPPTPTSEEDDMARLISEDGQKQAATDGVRVWPVPNIPIRNALAKTGLYGPLDTAGNPKVWPVPAGTIASMQEAAK